MKSINSKLQALLFLIITIFAVSCSEDYGEVSECIVAEIDSNKKDACDEVSSVKLYNFQGMDVFVFDFQSCFNDGGSNVLSSDCETLGVLGTIAGNNGINGVNFFENATLVRVVWDN